MPTFVLRLTAPRPDFAMTMTEEEQAVMGRHAEHWQPFLERGDMAVFGPVLDGTGSWGLGVLEAESEDEVRAHADHDPAVTSGTATMEIGTLLTGFVRPRAQAT